jgi:O-antigen ligase
MTQENVTHYSSDQGIKRFLFGDLSDTATNFDVAIILLLMVFLFSATLSIAVMNIAYGAAAILWVGRMVYRKRYEVPKTPLDNFLLAFVIAEALATIFAYNKGQSLLYMYRRVTLLPIIYVMLSSIRSTRMLKILFGTLMASLVFVSLWSLRDVFFHLPEYLLFQRRLREFQMYMTAGGMMMIGMLLVLPFVIHPKTPSKLRWFALASLVPIGTNLLFTFTRSSWLGFLAGAIVIGAFRAKKIFLPLILIVVTIVTLASPEMRERMSSIFNPYHPTNITRMHMWETGLRIFKDHPVVGVGDIGIEQVWPFYAPPENESVGHLHNNLMMWLVTLGSVGFVILIGLFVKVWITMSRIEKTLRDNWYLGSVALGCLAAIAGFHVNGLFEWNFGDAEIIMVVWTIVGMTLAAEKVAALEGKVA